MRSFRPASLALGSLVALSVSPAANATTKETQPETRSNPVIATPEGAKAQLHSGGVGYSVSAR